METQTITRHLLAALLCIAATFNLWAYDVQLNGIYYNLSGNEASVTRVPNGAPYSGNVTIPSAINYEGSYYTVTSIDEYAFYNCVDMYMINLPFTIERIGMYAFYGCTHLYGSNGNYYFYIPENVWFIGDYAFCGGNAITKFEVSPINSNYSSYGDAIYNKDKTKLVFYPCNSPQTVLTSSSFPSSLTVIGNGAFADAQALTSIEIPGTVTTIGGWAFDDCPVLKRVIIPASVTAIGMSAFRYAYDINTVICLASTPPGIYDDTFTCFDNATLIVRRPSLSAYSSADHWSNFSSIKPTGFDFVVDGVFYTITSSVNKTVAVVRAVDEQNFNSTDYVGDVNVPSTVTYEGVTYTVTKVNSFAFYYNRQLTSLNLPSTVSTIGERAFYYCENMQSLSLGDGVVDLGRYSLAFCSNLSSITLPETLTNIKEYTFSYCNGLTNVIIPDSVKTINNGAFLNCSSLQSVVLGSGVTNIGSTVFNNCNALTHINSMATTPPTIESNTFMTNHYNNAYLLVPKSSLNAYQQAQYWSNFTTMENTGETFEVNGIYYYINDDGKTATVTYRDQSYNSYSGSVDIPSQITHNGMTYTVSAIGEWAFNKCRSLTWVSIPGEVTSIGSHSFDNCTALPSISLPDKVTEIKDYAFYNCTSLRTISLNSNLKKIYSFSFAHSGLTSLSIPASVDSINASAFNYCNSLVNINVETANQKYCSLNGVLFSKNKKTLIAYPDAHAANYTVPACTEVIGGGAFRGCEMLTGITLPTSLHVIKSLAFWDNIALEEIVVPHGVTTIEHSAFGNCSAMRRAVLPATLTSLGYSTFNGVHNLTELVVKAQTPPQCEVRFDPRTGNSYEPFMTVHYSTVNLIVPTGSIAAYQAANVWKKFSQIEEEYFPIESIRGDANGDGNVSISDVSALIDYLLGSTSNLATGADCNRDGTLTIGDVSALIDYLLAKDWGDKKCIELWGLSGTDFGNLPWGAGGGSIGVDLQPLYPIQGYTYDDNGHGILEYTGYFTPNNYFYFVKADRTDQVNNDGGAFYVDQEDYYTIRFNTATHEVNITPYESYSGIIDIFSHIAMAGDFNYWVANTTFMTPVNPRGPENHDWYTTLILSSPTQLKFVYNEWQNYWGEDAFPYGTGSATGDNISVPAGEYQVMFNDITGNFIFVPIIYPEVPEW